MDRPAVTSIQLPPQFEIDHRIDSNPVLRLRRPAFSGEAEVSGYTNGRVRGLLVTHPDRARTIVVPRAIEPALPSDEVLVSRNVDAIRGTTAHSSWARIADWTTPRRASQATASGRLSPRPRNCFVCSSAADVLDPSALRSSPRMMGILMPRRRVAGIVNLETDWFFSHSALHDHHTELQRYRDLSLAIVFALAAYSPP